MQVRELGHSRGPTLARPTRAIQRKSIHIFSTVGCLLWLAGCAGGGVDAAPGGHRVLTFTRVDPNKDEISLSPGQSHTAQFVLTSGGLPIGGQTVTFSIQDPATPEGATLTPATATTDKSGVVEVVIRAGLETQFKLVARAGVAEAEVVVLVAFGIVGTVVADVYWPPTSRNRTRASNVDVTFLDRGVCRDIVPTSPPIPVRQRVPLPMDGGEAVFDTVQIDQSSAIVAVAKGSHGDPVAAGCVDVPGPGVVGGDKVTVAVRLDDVVPDPIGTFALVTVAELAPPPAAAVALAATWRDLADCPLDPAQLWLDCTIDALSPVTASDPLDCVPSPGPGAETALGDALIARRGAFITDLAGSASACRGARDGNGAVSLDAVVLGLYGSPLPAAVALLPAVGDDAAHILDRLALTSTLDVRAGVAPSTYLLTHTLTGASFGPRNQGFEVVLAPLGLPVLEAHATASIRDLEMTIASHGFTLRLGTAAKSAFAALALESRGLPGDPAGLVGLIAALARSNDGAATGCLALDAALCALTGRASGCVASACTAGLEALAARLTRAFDAADGAGLDLTLSGTAPLINQHLGGLADRLGSPITDVPAGVTSGDDQRATWMLELRTSLGRTQVSAQFEGSRQGP
jgi:hypothetical protein